jgi:hypothetical protein
VKNKQKYQKAGSEDISPDEGATELDERSANLYILEVTNDMQSGGQNWVPFQSHDLSLKNRGVA